MAARKLPALRAYMRIIITCACVLVAYCAIQLKTGIGPWADIPPIQGRPYYLGIFSDPNDLGQLFIISLAFIIYLLAISKSAASGLLLWCLGGWLIYGVVLTNSRGALLATLAILALECWRRFGKIAVVVAALLAIPALLAVTRLSQLSAGEESAMDRLEAWYQGIQMLRGSPLFGVGFGNFTNHSTLTAHNSIILPMAELGLPGLTIWLGIIWYSLRMLWWIGFSPHAVSELDPAIDPVPQRGHATGTMRPPVDTARKDEILAARGLLLTMTGFCVGAFFLSQSYEAPLFLLCGFAVARFANAATVLHDPPHYRLLKDVLRLAGVTVVAVIGMYFFVKVTI